MHELEARGVQRKLGCHVLHVKHVEQWMVYGGKVDGVRVRESDFPPRLGGPDRLFGKLMEPPRVQRISALRLTNVGHRIVVGNDEALDSLPRCLERNDAIWRS